MPAPTPAPEKRSPPPARRSPLAFAVACAALYTIVFYGITLVPVALNAEYARTAVWRLIYAFSNVLAVFLFLSCYDALFLLGTPLLLIISAGVAYLRLKFNIIINTNIVGALFETDLAEAREFFNAELVGWIALAAAASAGVCRAYVRRCRMGLDVRRALLRLYVLVAFTITFLFVSLGLGIKRPSETDCLHLLPLAAPVLLWLVWRGGPSRPAPRRALTWLMAAGLIATMLFVLVCCREQETFWKVLAAVALASAMQASLPPLAPAGAPPQPLPHALAACIALIPGLISPETSLTFLPTNAIYASAYYAIDRAAMRRAGQSRFDVASLPSEIDEARAEALTVVIVVGESARADHFQLNGYARATTPELAALPGVVSFTHTRSCAAATRVSVPCLMTRATEDTLEVTHTETSLIRIFRKHGFMTTWISNNQIYGRHDTPTSILAMEAEAQVFPGAFSDPETGNLDEAMLPALRDTLARRAGRQLVVVHQRGSHWHYAERYPPSFERFVPACKNGTPPYLCGSEGLVNAYDNSIAYTDHFLARVIDLLKDRTALLLYVSDHGQSLGEDGVFTHGSPERPEQRHVPMIWWASESFRRQADAPLAALASRRHQATRHDHVFHSVLGCAGFRGEAISAPLNLCRVD